MENQIQSALNETNADSIDLVREFNSLALEWCRRRVSPQTGYLHYCYHPEEVSRHDTIPVLENVCYAYALLKSRTAENIVEAKRLIQALLPFQSNQGSNDKGNFPIYIHEYPACKDRFLAYDILPFFYRILSEYSLVIGSDLLEKLKVSTKSLIYSCEEVYDETKTSYVASVKLGASLMAFAKFFHEGEYEKRGKVILQRALDMGATKEWYSVSDLGNIIMSLQLVYPSIACSPWRAFWDHLTRTYHTELATYTGPSLEEFWWKGESQVSLYHYMMANYNHKIPKALLNEDAFAICACAVQKCEDVLLKKQYPIQLKESSKELVWKSFQEQDLTATLFDHSLDKTESRWKGATPCKLLWKALSGYGSLVVQGGNYQTLVGCLTSSSISLEYVLSEEYDIEDREKRREVVLALDRAPHHIVTVNGQPATTFVFGDIITIRSGAFCFEVVFHFRGGKGEFMGHIMPGNRASQMASKYENRFEAYDRLFFLRTLRRESDCRIGVTITMKRVDE